MRRIFFDIDGVLAEFDENSSPEDLMREGYFYELRPQLDVIRALEILSEDPQYEVYTLSAVIRENKTALSEKKRWLNDNVRGIGTNIKTSFTYCGEDKEIGVPGGIQGTDILIDDYNFNLRNWERKGVAIKLLNGINNRHGSWKGLKTPADTQSILQTVYSC